MVGGNLLAIMDLNCFSQTSGGWTNEQIVDDFVNYARIVFERFGNKVPMWFTVNEPISFWYFL